MDIRMDQRGGKRQGRLCRIGPLVVKAITPACQQNGFTQARILLEWDSIIPLEFARFCIPVKVSFPPKQRTDGRLLVRATSSMATEIAYLEPLILSRINQFFGYQAISKITILQGPVLQKPLPVKHPRKVLPAETVASLEGCASAIENEELRSALLSWGISIASDRIRPW